MNEFLILCATHLTAFIGGVVVAKNLIRWFRGKFMSNPIQAIEDEIVKLRAKLDSLRKAP